MKKEDMNKVPIPARFAILAEQVRYLWSQLEEYSKIHLEYAKKALADLNKSSSSTSPSSSSSFRHKWTRTEQREKTKNAKYGQSPSASDTKTFSASNQDSNIPSRPCRICEKQGVKDQMHWHKECPRRTEYSASKSKKPWIKKQSSTPSKSSSSSGN